MRMAELDGELEGVRCAVWSQLGPAREMVQLAQAQAWGRAGAAVVGLQLERFSEEWEMYWAWLMHWECTHGCCERVFPHNDTQYSNLLELKSSRVGEPAHHKIRLILDIMSGMADCRSG